MTVSENIVHGLKKHISLLLAQQQKIYLPPPSVQVRLIKKVKALNSDGNASLYVMMQ